ncbi:MAG: hypothetical protein KDD61_12280 [Bdellovibrionales bacterium]|nr:hypothetical protein [Bdellovibrionales bacterium]
MSAPLPISLILLIFISGCSKMGAAIPESESLNSQIAASKITANCGDAMESAWYQCRPTMDKQYDVTDVYAEIRSSNTCSFLLVKNGADNQGTPQARVQGTPSISDVGECVVSFRLRRYRDHAEVFKIWQKINVQAAGGSDGGGVVDGGNNDGGGTDNGEGAPDPLPSPEPKDYAFYRSMGFVNVTEFGATPDDGKLDTQAIQNAVNYAFENSLVVYFPSGEFLVDKTIYMRQKDKNVTSDYNRTRVGHFLIGSYQGARPVIRLKDGVFNSCTGNCVTSPSISMPGTKICKVTTPTAIQAVFHFYRDHHGCTKETQGPEFNNGADHWNAVVRNIDFDLGKNNSSAAAIRMLAAEGSTIQEVKIMAHGAFSGIYRFPSSGGSINNLEVIGGKHGIFADNGRGGVSLLNNITLSEQTSTPLLINTIYPTTIVGLKATLNNVSLLDRSNNYIHITKNHIALIDGQIEFANNSNNRPVIQNDFRSIYLKNVFVKGASTIVNSTSNNKKLLASNSSTWTRVNEYSYAGTFKDISQFGEFGKLVNGAKTDSDYFLINTSNKGLTTSNVTLSQTVASPPEDLISKHQWTDQLCNLEDSQFIDVRDYGATPDDNKDDSQAIQDAIDNAPSFGNKVYLPKGTYKISRTLQLKYNTQLCGASRFNTILSTDGWTPSSNTPVIQSNGSAGARSTISEFKIELFNQRIYALRWISGRDSIVKDVWVFTMNAWTNSDTIGRQRMIITETGGGKWYNILGQVGGKPQEHSQTRHFLVDGTSEPLTFYYFHNQYITPVRAPMSEIRNSSNVTIFAGKNEIALDIKLAPDSSGKIALPKGTWPIVMGIYNSDNINIFGTEGLAQVDANRAWFELENVTNTTIVNVGRRNRTTGGAYHYAPEEWSFVKETKNGVTRSINAKGFMGLFKRDD